MTYFSATLTDTSPSVSWELDEIWDEITLSWDNASSPPSGWDLRVYGSPDENADAEFFLYPEPTWTSTPPAVYTGTPINFIRLVFVPFDPGAASIHVAITGTKRG